MSCQRLKRIQNWKFGLDTSSIMSAELYVDTWGIYLGGFASAKRADVLYIISLVTSYTISSFSMLLCIHSAVNGNTRLNAQPQRLNLLAWSAVQQRGQAILRRWRNNLHI
jgi:hypothetical protein